MAAALYGQAAFHEDTLHGRRAFVLENGRMRVSTLPGGGFIGEVRLKSEDPKKNVNPMRVPHYQTIDPYTYDIARHGDLYGTGIQRRLMSGYMGQFLCFPQFAASSPAEFRQDYGQHGEAIAVEWKLRKVDAQGGDVTLRYGADLALTNYRVERSITLPADETVAYVEESVENMAVYDRPMQWVQHITFGPPFLELNRTFADSSAARVVGDAREVRPFTGRSSTWILDVSRSKVWLTMYNADYAVLIGYIFESKPNQWVFDWQENRRAMEKPWDGKVVARALCIGDSVVSGLRNAVSRGSVEGVPAYSWIEARERRSQKYAMFLAEIPVGFKGAGAVTAEDGRIIVTERETGKTISIKAGRMW
jgi:hypothetical protein